MTGKRWSWLDEGVIPLASALMRVAWVTPLMKFALNNEFVIPPDARYPSWLILGLLFLANGTVRVTRDHPWGARITTAAGVMVVGLVLAYSVRLDVAHLDVWLGRFVDEEGSFRTGMPAVVIVVVATAALWWRGMTASWHDYAELFGGFLVGVLALGAMMLLAGPEAWESRGLDVWVSVVGFVLSALVALALIATYEMLSWERFASRGGPGFSRHWLIVVGSLVTVILGLGWVASRLTQGDIGRAVGKLLAPLWMLLRLAVEYLLLAWGYLVFEILGGVVEAIQIRLAASWDLIVSLLYRFVREPTEYGEGAAQTSALAERGLRFGFYAVLAATIIALFYIAFRRIRRNEPRGIKEEREYIWSRALILEQIRSFFRELRKRRVVAPLLPLDENEEARRAIRERYRQFLAHMSSRGRGRPPNVTPREYERRIADVLRRERQSLSVLTEAYLVARYAADPPTAQQVRDALRAFARIEAELGTG